MIAKFKKVPADRKRYVVDYADWVNENERISGVTFEGNVPADNFYVDAYTIDGTGLQVIFYISGGLSGYSYDVTVTSTTSLAQVKQDTIRFVVA
jgi:hypothetical protein